MDPTVSQPRRLHRFGPPALLAVVTLAAFALSLQGEFLNWDDDVTYLSNPHYRGLGPENLKWMFSDHYSHGLYMPLTWITCGVDYLIWGMNPVGYHVSSLLFHALNAVLFYLVALLLLGRARPEADPAALRWIAAAAAGFFSLHPMRVESVAWLTERRDVVSGAFFLLTLITYLKMTGLEPGSGARRKWLWISVSCFLGMLLSKPMAMTLPLVLLILDAFPLRRWSREKPVRLILEKLPFFALTIAAVVMTSITQRKAGALYTREAYPLLQSFAQPGYRIPFYLWKTILPFDLSPLYWYRPELGWRHLLGGIGLVGVTLGLWVKRREFPAALAAWVSYGLLISPVSGVVQVGPNFAADKYSYFASMPVALFAAALVFCFPLRRGVATAAAALLIGLAILSARQCLVWKDSLALWNRVIELDLGVYFSYNRRGQALASRGSWDLALADYDRSIALNGGWFESWASRARAREAKGDHAGAIDDATRALQLDPGATEALNTRGLALIRTGKLREAVRDCTRALELRPQYVEARLNRATALAMGGDLAGALADLDEAIKFDPQPTLFVRRATTRAMKGDLEGAIADFSEAIRLKPDFADAYARRGVARSERSDRAGAAQDFAKALEVAPPSWPQRKQVETLLQDVR